MGLAAAVFGVAIFPSGDVTVGVVPPTAVAVTGGTAGSATGVSFGDVTTVGVVAPTAVPVTGGTVGSATGVPGVAPVTPGVGGVAVAPLPGGIEVIPAGSPPRPFSNHHSKAPNSGIANNQSNHQGSSRSVVAAAAPPSGTKAVSVSVASPGVVVPMGGTTPAPVSFSDGVVVGSSASISGVGVAVDGPGGVTNPGGVTVEAASGDPDSGAIAAAIISCPGSEVAKPRKARVAGVAFSC